jgi:hypothetical protein
MSKEDLDGTAVYKMKLTMKGGNVRYIFLDAENFIELKSTMKRMSQAGEMEIGVTVLPSTAENLLRFLDSDGIIANIEDMKPQTDDPHWSKGTALYALEMKKGWFAERGIVAGEPVKGLPTSGAKR